MPLRERIKNLRVPKGNIAIFWLGNASFVIKTELGKIIYIDPYLSDYAEKIYGFKRIYPSLIKASEVETDYILLTHEHGDHLDLDSIPEIMKNNDVKLIAPKPCILKCLELNISKYKIIEVKEGRENTFEGFKVITVFADHEGLSPNAVGYILDFNGILLYNTGDTSYSPDKMKYAISLKPDILITPINGKFKNINPIEAALLARDCKSKIVIPSHFWMFAQHNGDLLSFVKYVDKIAKSTKYKLITMGDYHLYPED